MVFLRNVHAEEIRRFKDVLVQVREELGIKWEPRLLPENPSYHPKTTKPYLCLITENIHTCLFPEG
jgi:hypothetical protein